MEMFHNLTKDPQYISLLQEFKAQIQQTQLKAVFTVNAELIALHWRLGKLILHRQSQTEWGSKVIDQLAEDLKKAYPEAKGYSVRNLKYMRKFAEIYPDFEIVQAPLAQITWYHNLALLEKVATVEQRLWYAEKTVEHGWSRNILVMQIQSQLYERQASEKQKITNFAARLPAPQSDLANNALKDPYIFDFLTVGTAAKEREIERDLTKHITQFLLELGKGFAFVGRQYHLSVGSSDFYIDLLFYHLELRSFVVIELKTGEFTPEHAGKLNFYLSVVDDRLKKSTDNPSIGILLCKTKDKTLAEYALKDMSKPIGISEYKLMESLPKDLGKNLPSIEELEEELKQLSLQLDEDKEQ